MSHAEFSLAVSVMAVTVFLHMLIT